MNRKLWTRQVPLALLIGACVMITSAWQGKPGKITHTTNDSIPDRNKKIKDIDDALEELEKSRMELDKTINDADWKKMNEQLNASMKELKVNMEQMKKELANSMKEIDMAKIQADVQKTMKNIDFEKMNNDMHKAIAEIDGDKIKAQIDKAMKEVDFDKIKSQIDASLSKIEWDKMKQEMDHVRDVDMKKVQDEMQNLRPEIEKSMEGAKAGIETAKKKIIAYKNFLGGLEKDGLINKDNYTIEYQSGELIINGKKQPHDVVRKYQDFLKDKKDFTIKKDKDGFDINND
ncbi:MAG: hypothetical protein ACJ75F_13830 [Flavisolibacter sp.]